jgi:hypothetical protein
MKRKQCTYTKRDSTKCTSFAMNGSDYCYRHNPRISSEEKNEASSKGGKSALCDEFITTPLPEIKIQKIQDVVTLLADTINNMRSGKISQKSGTSIGYLSFILLMAMDKAKEEKEQEKEEKLKAEGKWRPEPQYVPKFYRYKDEFYLDKDGNPLIVEKDGTECYPQKEYEPEVNVEPCIKKTKSRESGSSKFYPNKECIKEFEEDTEEKEEDLVDSS